MSARRGDREDRGAAAVETALCICFIVLPLTFLTISYAYMLSFRQSVSQASAEGARAAAVAPPSTAGGSGDTTRAAVQKAINAALSSGVTCDLGSGSLKRGSAPVGTCSLKDEGTSQRVTLDYNYKDNPLLPSFGFGALLPDHLMYSASAETSQ